MTQVQSRPRLPKGVSRRRHTLTNRRATEGADAPGPALDRSVPLPSGRAVVGALLVTTAAIGVFVAYRAGSDGPSTPVVTVSTDIAAGHRLQADDLVVERADLPTAGGAHVFASVDDVVGSVALAPLRAGDIVQQSAVLTPAAGDPRSAREFSFAVDRERALNGDLQRGEHVDVLATFGANDGAYTSVVARDVALVNVDAGGRSSGIATATKLTVTVALANGDDVLKLAHATQVAPITLVRTSRSEVSTAGTLDTYRTPGAASPSGTKPDSRPTPSSEPTTGKGG